MSTISSASQNVESPEELPVCTTVSCCDNTIQCNERFFFESSCFFERQSNRWEARPKTRVWGALLL
jgi:hypothetical protein